jgi:hypothetical protein
MKKIFTFILFATFAINIQAQTKEKKAFDKTMETINEMDQMLGKDFTQIKSALEVVNGANFEMGECMVLGAYADEGFKKQCKTLEDEFGKMFNNSTWNFEKYNANGQSLVKVKTKSGQTESSSYSGFQGDATIKIGALIQGLTMQAYFYQSKEDKTKYMMMFPVSQMGVFVELTKKDGKIASIQVQNNNTDAATSATPKVTEVAPTITKVKDVKSKVKTKLLKKVKL